MLTMPACPHPVSTTSPLSRTFSTTAWSSCTSGSGCQPPSRQAWWAGGIPVSNASVAIDLAGHQQHPVQQERGLALLDDGETGALDGGAARRRQLEHPVRTGDAPAGPEVGVQQDRHPAPTEPAGQPLQPHHVVEVAVAEHDRLEAVRSQSQPVQVGHYPVRGDAGVEQHPPGPAAMPDLDQRGETVLGPQHVDGRPPGGQLAGQHRQRGGRAGQPPTADQPDVGQQHVAGVVHHGRDVHPVHRFQRDLDHRPAASTKGGRNGRAAPLAGS